MLFVSLRDLQWRRRRFLIGVLATGLVFALALLITGISASFHNEVSRTVDAFGADEWIVSARATGPFTTPVLFAQSSEQAVRAANPQVSAITPVAVLRFTVTTTRVRDINVIGIPVDARLGAPKIHDGRALRNRGELVVDSTLNAKVGKQLAIGGGEFTVVGRTSGVSYFAGTPVVFMALPDAQKISLGSQPLVSSLLVRGKLTNVPAGLRAVTSSAAISDLHRPLKSATGTIDILRVLLWIVAAGIIGSVLYLQAIERTRDFAVFKATGVTGRALVTGLAFQAVVLAASAAIVAIVLEFVLAPTMPMRVETPASALLFLPVVAIVVGLLASISGLRRAVGVDPALAFGG
ncbi:MAG TPA: ABC transporter permease [Acidimicrobiia bacterium]|nr:ABC transporter permease [Acidimicrobiia bacterium]